ncbi:MAG: hypothetical protein Q8M09_16620 [Pseudomonadota bacterium]|nr:hypothetical protein [Hydrogenophaga sp.]MDP1905842.1 hypothetical protein [Pseudomonadota bacterium]MDP2352415.1 hypothetical protein [Pseudomonadota bacterium]
MKPLSFLSVLALCVSTLAIAPGAQARNAQDIPLTQQAKVLNIVNAPPYLYIEATQGKNTIWLAGTSIAVKKGDVIDFDEGMVMHNFYSKTLKRTFPSVIFVNRMAVAGKRK